MLDTWDRASIQIKDSESDGLTKYRSIKIDINRLRDQVLLYQIYLGNYFLIYDDL